MKFERKIGFRVILVSFIVQALSVGTGLCQKYLFPKPVSKEKAVTKTIKECCNEALYGIISPYLDLPESKSDKVLGITLVGISSGASGYMSPFTTNMYGDVEIIDSTIDFPV